MFMGISGRFVILDVTHFVMAHMRTLAVAVAACGDPHPQAQTVARALH